MEIYQKYIEEKIGADGNVESCKLIVPEVFNFGYDIVDKIAEEEPERTAILYCSEDGARHAITFKDMKEESDKAASYFRSLGVGKGDCVMLVLRRHYQFWFALIGLHKLGAIAVPTSFMLKTEEFTYRFEKINIKAIVCTNNDQVNSRIEEAERQSGKSFKKIIVREKRAGWLQFDEGLENAEEFVPLEVSEWPDIYDTMLIYFTSGTESQPKMVKHDFSYPIGHIPTAKYWQNVDPEGLHLTIADTGWAKSVWGKLYGQWILKAAVSVYDYSKFSPQALLTRLQEDKVTTLCAPSTIYRVLVQQDLSRYDLSHVQHYVVAGEALNPEVIQRFYQMTGKRIHEGYGQTEATLIIGVMHWMDVKPGAMGKAGLQYDIELLDPEGQPVPQGEVGEICIKAEIHEIPGMFLSYEGQNESLMKWNDGIFHTGDLAWCDEDGYYWFVGRKDDVFKSAGFRISPFEIENLVMEFPGVLECAVTGEPDPLRGNVIKATIVLTEGIEATNKLKNEIKDFLKGRSASYKIPRKIEFVDELPKTTSGKIRHSAIRKGHGH